MSKRKGAWRFSAVWTFPGHMAATTSTDPSHLKRELQKMETEMKRLVLGAQKFPLYLRNIQLKYKPSDWELARTKTPIHLPVHGYIQSDKQRAIDYYSLQSWFDANWIPVENQLRRDATYQAWVQDNPAYRHVQVDGTPAVARAGRHKKQKQVLHAALSYHFFEFASVVPCLAQGHSLRFDLFV
jgi:hypothetical protein